MSQSQKRPGVRDISELKARLGLKKGGPAAKRGGGGGGGVVPPPGGVVPPPGVPAPPGAQKPASDDPFAAMNEMAGQAAHARSTGPEIVVVEKGGDVESVEHKTKGTTYAKYAGIVLVPLILGVVVGQIGTQAKIFNKTIEDAALLAEDVKNLSGSLNQIHGAFLDAKGDFEVYDEEFLDQLEAIDLYTPDMDEVYGSYMYELDADSVKAILEYYTLAQELQTDVGKFTDQARRDKALLSTAEEEKKKATPENDLTGLQKYRWGVLLEVPTEKEAKQGQAPGGKLVELGRPICPGGEPTNTGACPGSPPIGWEVREDPTQGFGQAELVTPNNGFAGDRVLMVRESVTFEGLIKGSKELVAELRYRAEFQDLFERSSKLVEQGSRVKNYLEAKGKEDEKFTFFL